MHKSAQSRESGYAILFIFLTMAIVGIMLYAAMPRVAFEAQRDQEQMLIDRGEQYKRAIQVYFRKFKKYPAKIEDLENSSNQRFLRKRYKDPMTGKDEWRPIHISASGQFIDSLTQKANKKKPDAASVNNFITELKPIGDTGNTGNAMVNPGLRRRPSDQPGGGGGGDIAGQLPGNPVPGVSPSENGDLGLIETPDTNLAVGPNGQQLNPPAPGVPGGLAFGPGDANSPNNPNNPNNPNGLYPSGINPRRFVNGMPNPPIPNGPQSNGQNSSGAAMIQNLLTSPRPGGPPPGIFGANQSNDVGPIGQPNGIGGNDPATQNLPTPQTPQNVFGSGTGLAGSNQPGSQLGGALNNGTVGGQTVGGGIAGFASKSERPGIKIYNEKTKYNEWEFIYDYAKDKTMGGGQTIPTQNANPGLISPNAPDPSPNPNPPTNPSPPPPSPSGN